MGVEYRDGQNYPATYEEYVPPGAVARCMLEMMDYLYPVGCYFETTDTDFDPNQTFGGTWELETEGLVHISSGENYEVSTDAQDGGEAEHILNANEIPSHNHTPRIPLNESGYGTQIGPWGVYIRNFSGTPQLVDTGNSVIKNINARSIVSNNVGGGQAHNNMPPYKIVNRWHRTA